MMEAIKQKIKELFRSTPSDVGVGFGFKQVDGQYTNELGIVFNVVKKLPLSEIPENQILPSTIEINGVVYNTDVIESGGWLPLVCDNSSSNPCYPYGFPPEPTLTPNSQRMRPLKGGCVTTSNIGSGTLGFVAKHIATGKLVGVTNGHVMVNPIFDPVSIQYPGDYKLPTDGFKLFINANPAYEVYGYSNRVTSDLYGNNLYTEKPRKDPFLNRVDAGILALRQKDSNGVDLITSESWKQVGLDIGTTPPPFATTQELDNLLNYPNLEVASSGITTGPKQGTCGLKISAIHSFGVSTDGYSYEDCFTYTRINPDCLYPISSGDSGSAILAKINGVWKIIGLAFLGSYNNLTGKGCRIDHIASALGIQAWDGTITPTSFIDPNSIEIIITEGRSADQSLIVNNKTYRQVLITREAPGNSTTTTTTTTIGVSTTTTTTTPAPTTTTTTTPVPTTTTTTTAGTVFKSFTFNSGIAGSSATVCAFTTYNGTAFFTGPGTYPTTGSALYFTQNLSDPFRFTGWIKISNGHAIQGGGNSSNVIANDVTC